MSTEPKAVDFSEYYFRVRIVDVLATLAALRAEVSNSSNADKIDKVALGTDLSVAVTSIEINFH